MFFCEREIFFVLMLLSETCTQGAIFARVFTAILWCSTCDLFFAFGTKTCKLEKEELVFLFMLNVKIHGISQDTEPVTCVLGLEGIALL
jgi:hypothetical protein